MPPNRSQDAGKGLGEGAVKRMSWRACIVSLGCSLATVGPASLWSCAPAPAAAQTAFPPAGSLVSFALTAADGATITDQSYRGKWLVIYFGYTFCPDVCPTTLMDIAGALDRLGPRAAAVQGLFVTVDPRRDTPSVLAEYLKSFDPRLVGLTGTPTQIAQAAKSFHVFYERRETDDGGYSYDHSAFVYVVDPDGRLVKVMTGEGGSLQIAETLSALIDTKRRRADRAGLRHYRRD
jgi:protein SCO1/2